MNIEEVKKLKEELDRKLAVLESKLNENNEKMQKSKERLIELGYTEEQINDVKFLEEELDRLDKQLSEQMQTLQEQINEYEDKFGKII